MINTQMTDFYLTQLIKNMMSGDSIVPNPETSVMGESLSEKAAKKAGVRVDSRGVPIINNGVDAQAYMDALNELMKDTYISTNTGVLTSGMTYTYDDIYALNGEIVIVQCGGKAPHPVTVQLSPSDVEVIMAASIENQIDPTIIVADIAHESKFLPNVTSYAGAAGLMQILPQFAQPNIDKCRELIVSLDGDPNNLYDKTTNICTGATVIRYWIDQYGNNEEPMRALLQGNRDYIQNPETGWSEDATKVGKEFLDIKKQLDDIIANS